MRLAHDLYRVQEGQRRFSEAVDLCIAQVRPGTEGWAMIDVIAIIVNLEDQLREYGDRGLRPMIAKWERRLRRINKRG